MIYSQIITEKLNSYFINRLNLKPYRRGWLKGECPYCGKANKFGVNVDKGRVNCFTCGPHDNPIKAIMELEKLQTRTEVYNLLKTFEGIEYLSPVEEVREISKVELPKSFTLMSFGNSMTADLARQYMKGRGFNIMNLTIKGIGYCSEGEYAGCIILPFYQRGMLIYFIARRFIHIHGEKFKNPRAEDFGIGKSMLIYNIDSLAIYRKIRLVESVTNAETLGLSAIATLGKKLSSYQLSTIIKSPVESVVIILDDDAWEEALVLGLKLVMLKKVKVVKMPEGLDVNKVGKKKTLELEKMAPFETYNSLITKYKQIEKPFYSPDRG